MEVPETRSEIIAAMRSMDIADVEDSVPLHELQHQLWRACFALTQTKVAEDAAVSAMPESVSRDSAIRLHRIYELMATDPIKGVCVLTDAFYTSTNDYPFQMATLATGGTKRVLLAMRERMHSTPAFRFRDAVS